ncbi:MAG TPA: DegT/DnrJ/EryC1/StrS family aminotransferase [Thermoanaerobaculia bacterium]|nr:DegT/DnrJ/EryC1/StrS family aminotransferase [Thermoanaerobaculia bacterium]HQR67133.1 DegT/DnrJ/EryC1/StrS family aminotransferase [Thermoanaerobaculia bacterium]
MPSVTAPAAVAVPLLDLKKQYATIREEVRRTADEVFESQYFILGPRVEAFEKAVAAYVGTKHAVGMSSGTDAQLAAMMALRIGPGDDVVTSPYTFFSSAGAIARLGARPVFCDIDPATFNVDPVKLANAITPKTKAIQPIHLYGQCADMDPIVEVARKKGIPVIEDACQSLGAAYRGKKAGSMSAFGCFSFFPSKNLGAFGDGGMVTTDDDATAQSLRAMRMHGETSRYYHRFVGGNFRLDAFQAAVLHVKLPHLDGWAEGRRKNAKEIEALYLEYGGLPYDKGGLSFPREAAGRFHVFNQFVVRVGKGRRDALKERLQERQIGHAIYYPVPLHLQECFADLGGKAGDFPESEKAANETLALPVFPELTADQKRFLAFTLAEFSRQG